MRRRGTTFQPGGSRQKGAAAVEFALVFLLFLSVFYAIVCYGLVFAAQQSLTLAAEEGARAAVQDAPDQATRLTRAQNTASGLVNWLSGVSVAAAAAPCAANPAAECVTVTVSYDYQANPLVPSLPLLGVAVPDTLQSTATVQL